MAKNVSAANGKKNDILGYILIPVFAVAIVLFFFEMFAREIEGFQMRKNCTAVTTGTVVSAESHHPTNKPTYYTALIKPDDPSLFSGGLLSAGNRDGEARNSHPYQKGDVVSIFYDPEDSSTYYVDYDKPTIWPVPWLIAAALVIFVIRLLIRLLKYAVLYYRAGRGG